MIENSKNSQDKSENQVDFGFHKVGEDQKEHEVRHVFDSVASKYDLMNDLLSLWAHRFWKRRCITEASVKKGMRVLDIASGTADLAIEFAKKTGAGNVIASDINHEMLAIGKKRLTAAGLPAETIEADAEQLPFTDNTFDVVTVSFGIRNMTHKDRALSEMLRVLKPGGRLLVLEFSQCQKWMKPFYDFYSFKFMPWLGAKIVGDASSYLYLAESIRMHPNQEKFAELMKVAGFEDVIWHNLSFGICALHIGTKK